MVLTRLIPQSCLDFKTVLLPEVTSISCIRVIPGWILESVSLVRGLSTTEMFIPDFLVDSVSVLEFKKNFDKHMCNTKTNTVFKGYYMGREAVLPLATDPQE